ncbi:MAG: hypothetical protein WC979_04845 [Candidatus Pacearchaeota archaeon]|jgi:hypothetical protein
MRPPIEFLFPPEIGLELLYSFVIIICSLMVYVATKEMYELSSYKGIKYFRQAFLFFAFAYFFRYFLQFCFLLFGKGEFFDLSPRLLGSISTFLFLYFSSMAILYLMYSVMWKKSNHSMTKIYFFNFVSLIISLTALLFAGREVFFVLNLILLIIVLFSLFIAYKDSKNKSGKSLYLIYLLLSIFWSLNIIDILIPRFSQVYKLIIYLVSILLFMIILYKVLRKTGD